MDSYIRFVTRSQLAQDCRGVVPGLLNGNRGGYSSSQRSRPYPFGGPPRVYPGPPPKMVSALIDPGSFDRPWALSGKGRASPKQKEATPSFVWWSRLNRSSTTFHHRHHHPTKTFRRVSCPLFPQ